MLSLALGSRLAQLRETGDFLAAVHAGSEEQAFLLRLSWEVAQILGLRWDKVPDKRRPQYRPEQRFRILRIKDLLVLSREETARMFKVTSGTIARWEQEALARPGREAIGLLVQPSPPLRRYADVVRHMVQTMALAGFEGCETIARTLSRAGWRI